MNKLAIYTLLIVSAITHYSHAQNSNWYVKANVGLSQMSDTSGRFNNDAISDGAVTVDLDTGFLAGAGVGYSLSPRWAVEVDWEYRSNDSETVIANADQIGGNYASNIFSLRSLYYLETTQPLRWYIGGGLTVAQEIDIDLENAVGEQSYSGSGEFGYQLFGGAEYHFNRTWKAQAEVRFNRLSDTSLDGEEGAQGDISGLDYNNSTVQVALAYTF